MSDDAASLSGRQAGWTRSAQDAAEAEHRPNEEPEAQARAEDVAAPGRESRRPVTRRSTPVAILLTVLVVVSAAVGVLTVVALADAVAGAGLALVAGVAAQIAVLAFVTVRAYPPEAKVPWATLVVLTILITAFIPLTYLAWVWTSRKKWVARDVTRLPGL